MTAQKTGIGDDARNVPVAESPIARRRLLWVVTCVALVTNTLSLASTHLWVFPDSIDYIQLAAGIVREFNFKDELFLVRTPGYPIFLALLFAMLGTLSGSAILLLQHGMAIGTAVITAALAWELFERRGVALLAGVLCACSLQTLSYANMVLTETPYTLAFVGCVYALVKYLRGGEHFLLIASFLIGIGYLLRPVGLILLPIAGLAVFIKHTLMRSPNVKSTFISSVLLRDFVRAGAPALMVAAPWMMVSTFSHRSLQASRCLDYVLYFRAVTTEGLASDQSEALKDIVAVVAEAKAAGLLPAQANHQDRGTVMKAYEKVRGQGFAHASLMMGRAGRDLLLANPIEVAIGTIKYSAWMLLTPDPVYRFLPGGAAGKNGKRDRDAEFYNISTYSAGEGSWAPTLAKAGEFIALENDRRLATPLWAALCKGFYAWIELPSPGLGGRSVFEIWTGLCVIGAMMALFLRQRLLWLIVLAAIALHVGTSAFLGGPQTRYTAPAKPFMVLCSAGLFWSIINLAHFCMQSYTPKSIPKTALNSSTSAVVSA